MAVKKRLLLVDDDEALRGELVEQFAVYEEFETHDVGTATAGIEAAKAQTFDLIVLDVDLPDMLGTEACELMRKAGVAAPIVMLTANEGEMNEILGLNSGANDYVTKPFRFSVLLARLRAHLRSFEQSEEAVFQILKRFGDIIQASPRIHLKLMFIACVKKLSLKKGRRL